MRTEEQKIARRLWDIENRDVVLNYRKKWYYKYRNRILEQRKEYNPIRNKVVKVYRDKHPESVKYWNHKRRDLTRDLTIKTVQAVYEDNIKKYGTLTCYLCLATVEFKKDHLEHKIPLCRGGNNVKENLDISCAKCNMSKHDKTEEEFRRAYNDTLA